MPSVDGYDVQKVLGILSELGVRMSSTNFGEFLILDFVRSLKPMGNRLGKSLEKKPYSPSLL